MTSNSELRRLIVYCVERAEKGTILNYNYIHVIAELACQKRLKMKESNRLIIVLKETFALKTGKDGFNNFPGSKENDCHTCFVIKPSFGTRQRYRPMAGDRLDDVNRLLQKKNVSESQHDFDKIEKT